MALDSMSADDQPIHAAHEQLLLSPTPLLLPLDPSPKEITCSQVLISDSVFGKI